MSDRTPSAATPLPRRCRWFGHKWGHTKWDGTCFSASDWKERHTHRGVRECYRCGAQEKVEWFDEHMAWAEFRRENEDRRLEEVIRRATR